MRDCVLSGLDDYRDMFCLNDSELQGKILEFGCGPTLVNKELHEKKRFIVSMDKLFSLDKEALVKKIASDVQSRPHAIETFIADFDKGLNEKRYLPMVDDNLPFADFTFDLALCSHFLFVETGKYDEERHVQIIKELARVAKEVRIFPLMNGQQPSIILGPVLLELQKHNYGAEVKDVSVAQNNNAMLRVWAEQCVL